MKVSLWGIKKGMTQIPDQVGNYIPVTVILVTPNIIVQAKAEKNNEYNTVVIQTALVECKTKDLNKPQLGHLKKNNIAPCRYLKEMRMEIKEGESVPEIISRFPVGSPLDISCFKKEDKIKITGISKGKGFAGAIKRHGFSRGATSHGGGPVHRSIGSVGGGRGTRQKVSKGKKMPGRMGGQQVSVRNLEIVEILPLENTKNQIILVRGAVPGNKKGLVKLSKI